MNDLVELNLELSKAYLTDCITYLDEMIEWLNRVESNLDDLRYYLPN